MSDPPYPKYRCRRCEDWGSIVAPDGRGTLLCPEPIHHAATTPITSPTTGEESENRDRDDDGR